MREKNSRHDTLLQNWLNEQTAGQDFDSNTVLALASDICPKANERRNLTQR